MAGIYLDVPRSLADLLAEDGFLVPPAARGGTADVLVAIGTGIGVAADLSTVLVSRSDIARFIWGHLRSWGRTPDEGRRITMTITLKDNETVISGNLSGGSPEALLRAIEGALLAVTDDDARR